MELSAEGCEALALALALSRWGLDEVSSRIEQHYGQHGLSSQRESQQHQESQREFQRGKAARNSGGASGENSSSVAQVCLALANVAPLILRLRELERALEEQHGDADDRDDGGKSSVGRGMAEDARNISWASLAHEALQVAPDLRTVLSEYNWCYRLRKRTESDGGADYSVGGVDLRTPPLPADYVREALCWSAFGTHSESSAWLGHGRFWRSRFASGGPSLSAGQKLENAAGNAMNDFDVIEDGFCPLKQARCVFADFPSIRRDFPQTTSMDDEGVVAWLLRAGAVLSAGQVARLRPDTGDHAGLLGIDSMERLESLVDLRPESAHVGFRFRSGGRAALLPTGPNFRDCWRAGFSTDGRFIDAKGIGTHADADISSPKVTGLLGFADALREISFQRLVQRLIDKSADDERAGASTSALSTVKFYAILDTGLCYKETNPATGWKGERCVIVLREGSSRFLPEYDSMSFAGNFSGNTADLNGAREMRRLLHQHGASAEFCPVGSFMVNASANSASAVELVSKQVEAALSLGFSKGNWNLQADATGMRFMDHSDYYVLPNSPLPAAWRMSEKALRNAFLLSPPYHLEVAIREGGHAFSEWLHGKPVKDEKEALQIAAEAHMELSQDTKLREAASGFTSDGLIKQGKPEYCMCWFMELDDSEVARWSLEAPKEFDGDALSGEIARRLDGLLHDV